MIEKLNNYSEILRYRADTQADDLAYVFLENGNAETQRYSYSELELKVKRMAASLQQAGAANQRVMIVMDSELDFALAFYACLYAGATAVTTIVPHTREQFRRLAIVMEDAEASLIIAKAEHNRMITEQIEEGVFKSKATLLDFEELPFGWIDTWIEPASNWEDVALLQYTSGSTTDPKGVQVTHRNLASIGEYHERCFGLSKQDFSVSWLPLSHDMGLILGVLQCLYSGYPGALMTPLAFIKRPLRWLQAISDYRASFTIAPNFAYDMCSELATEKSIAALDLHRFTGIYNAAEPVRPNSMNRFYETFKSTGIKRESMGVAYGMAESTLAVTASIRGAGMKYFDADIAELEQGRAVSSIATSDSRTIVGCGVAHGEIDFAIADSQTLEEQSDHIIGEVFVRGEIVAEGYWQNPEATADAFDLHLSNGKGPYLRTGDLGFVDRDGELFITGRCKDLIIVNGKNHAPQDIEFSIERVSDFIRQRCASAFSINISDQELVVAIAELEKGTTDASDIENLGKEVISHITKEHNVPMLEVVFVKRGECPKTTTGKLQRQRSKNLYLNNEFTVVSSYVNPVFKNIA